MGNEDVFPVATDTTHMVQIALGIAQWQSMDLKVKQPKVQFQIPIITKNIKKKTQSKLKK